MIRRSMSMVIAGALALIAIPIVGSPTPVSAVATYTSSLYEMNEPAGSSVLVDSSGNGLNGSSGPNVLKGVVYDGATAHRYQRLVIDPATGQPRINPATNKPWVRAPADPPVEPERLDTVPSTTMQNADSQDFAVTVRYRTDRPFGNLIQKGQNQTPGGYFKIELPNGRPTCLFKGVLNGQVAQRAVMAPVGYELNDNAWHIVTCERLASRVAMYIDGVEVRRLAGSTGNIANTKNLSIAGKSECDQDEVTCDYFVGDIDWVRIEKGSVGPANTPPKANFNATCTNLDCTYTGASSTDNGFIASYAWTFGDTTNNTATGVTPSHTYTTAGTKSITLTVTDNQGLTNSVTKSYRVTANPPPTASFTSSCTQGACTFDGSASSDPGGSIAGYAWTFGDTADNTATGATPSHTYTTSGNKTVTLTVTDNAGATGSVTHTVAVTVTPPANAAPTAAFTSACADRSCAFDGSTSTDDGGIVSYDWDFGDGTTPHGTGVAPSHPYAAAGPYDVVLTVTDAQGLTNSVTITTTVPDNAAPVAAFTSSCTGLSCTFTNTSTDNPPVSYAWTFGDGAVSDAANPTHSYADADTYLVELTVTDSFGSASSVDHHVTVAPIASPAVTFVGQTSVSNQLTTHVATIPVDVQPGDGLLLFFSSGTNATVGQPTNVTGWTQVDTLMGVNGSTTVWSKAAAAGNAGAQVRVTVSALSKGNMTVLAYRGTSTNPVAGFARTLVTANSAARTTPTTAVAASTVVVSYWMHRDSASTALTVPAGLTSRATGTQSGGGRITTLAADSGTTPVPAGPAYGGKTATAGAASTLATTWTIVLAPA
jgi:PKD repeat protein